MATKLLAVFLLLQASEIFAVRNKAKNTVALDGEGTAELQDQEEEGTAELQDSSQTMQAVVEHLLAYSKKLEAENQELQDELDARNEEEEEDEGEEEEETIKEADLLEAESQDDQEEEANYWCKCTSAQKCSGRKLRKENSCKEFDATGKARKGKELTLTDDADVWTAYHRFDGYFGMPAQATYEPFKATDKADWTREHKVKRGEGTGAGGRGDYEEVDATPRKKPIAKGTTVTVVGRKKMTRPDGTKGFMVLVDAEKYGDIKTTVVHPRNALRAGNWDGFIDSRKFKEVKCKWVKQGAFKGVCKPK